MLIAPEPRMPEMKLPKALNMPDKIASNADPWPFPKFAKPAPILSAKPTIPLRGMEFSRLDNGRLFENFKRKITKQIIIHQVHGFLFWNRVLQNLTVVSAVLLLLALLLLEASVVVPQTPDYVLWSVSQGWYASSSQFQSNSIYLKSYSKLFNRLLFCNYWLNHFSSAAFISSELAENYSHNLPRELWYHRPHFDHFPK